MQRAMACGIGLWLLAACAPRAPAVPPAAQRPVAAPPAAGVASAAWLSPLERDHALVGRIWDVAGRRYLDESALRAQAVSAPLLVVGEQHDNADAHRLQARLLGALVAAQRAPALVAEMLDETEQPQIDQTLREHPLDADAFARAVDWEHSGWPSWSMYQPVFAAALSARLPIIAAGVERKRTMSIARSGLGSLEPGLVERFGLEQPLAPTEQSAIRDEMRDTHCGMLPESMLDSMVLVQRVRDAVLASHLLAAGAGGALLIAGNGHARSDRGVPALLQRLGRRVLSIALLEVQHDWREPTQYAGAFGVATLPFDYVWFVPRASDSDHCAELRAQNATAHAAPPPTPEPAPGQLCQPNSSCYDGCNWRSCDASGQHLTSTLKACSFMIDQLVVFPSGSADIQRASADYPAILAAARRAITPKDRKLSIVGYSDDKETTGRESQKRLAEQRAEAVRQELVQRGLPRERLEIAVADERHHVLTRDTRRTVVRFSANPNQLRPEDVPVDSPAHARLCPP